MSEERQGFFSSLFGSRSDEEPRTDFFSLPMGANPDRDVVVGQDELGNPLYRSPRGETYSIRTVIPEREFETEAGTIDRALEVGSNLVEGAVDSAVSGFTAPARALRGESLTYGDAFETAGMAQTGALGMSAPQGAIRSGALRSETPSVRLMSDMDELTADPEVSALSALDIDPNLRDSWREQNRVNQRQQRNPNVQQAVQGLMDREITSAEFREIAGGFQPIRPLTEVPALPSLEEIIFALDANKVDRGIIGVNKGIEDGTYVASRLDIPAYETYDTWVVSLHDGTGNSLGGKSIGYSQTAVLNDVTFGSVPRAAANIAAGKPKTTIARIFGEWENADPEQVHAMAQDLMDDPEWTQVGMNPFRASYFYDKADGTPVVAADQVIQVGPLVLARNVTRADPDDPMFRINPRDEDSPRFNRGGLALGEATKGIRTLEGMEMAMKKFQLDRKDADKDGDGEVSKLEEIQGEAAQRTVGKDELPEMNCGGIMMPEMEIDPISGNEVPLGSTPENVRDDIPAMLSQDEYVLPAHVVKWHGLKHIQEMQMEAEAGLMSMAMEGLIGGMEMEEAAEADEDDMMEDEYVESMDVDVDVPTVEVEDDMEEEAYEEAPQTSELPGMVKKQKYAFIIS